VKSRSKRELLLMNFCEACNRLDRIVGIIQFVVNIGWDVEVRVGNRIINYSRLNRERLRPLLLRPVLMKHPIWNSNRMTVLPIDGSLVEDSADCNTGNCIQRSFRICYGYDDGCNGTFSHGFFFLMKWLLYCHLIIDPAGMAVGAKKSKGSFAPGFKLESSGSDSEESVDEKKGN